MATPKIKNKKAYREFHIEDKIEAGIVLQGTEVKSMRCGNVNIGDAFVRHQGEELYLFNLHISEYAQRGYSSHDPLRKRKLLLHKREIRRMSGKIRERGYTVIPLEIYFNKRGYAKVLLGLCRGKKLYDKRQDMKKRDMKREMDRYYKR